MPAQERTEVGGAAEVAVTTQALFDDLSTARIDYIGPLTTSQKHGLEASRFAEIGELGFYGTDLGSSYPINGGQELRFLFGDTAPALGSEWLFARDTIATHAANHQLEPGTGPDLTFSRLNVTDGVFMPVTVNVCDPASGNAQIYPNTSLWMQAHDAHCGVAPNNCLLPLLSDADTSIYPCGKELDLGPFNVPVDGIEFNGSEYVLFAGGAHFVDAENRIGWTTSVMAKAVSSAGVGDGAYDWLYGLPGEFFAAGQLVRRGNTLYRFGTGTPYRESQLRLARIPIAQIENADAWEYYNGSGWSSQWTHATPIIQEDNGVNCMGEISVRFFDDLDRFLLTYNCAADGKIYFRESVGSGAPTSWAPRRVLMDNEDAFGRLLHRPECDGASVEGCVVTTGRSGVTGTDDGLSDFTREAEPGYGYAPDLIPQWSRPAGDGYQVAFTLSSWNPYQVHLLRAVLTTGGEPAPAPVFAPPVQEPVPDFQLWEQSGSPGFGIVHPPGEYEFMTSFTAQGDDATGEARTTVLVARDTVALEFKVHGGNWYSTAVALIDHDGNVVRASRGRMANPPQGEVCVRWDLRDYRGQILTLMMIDNAVSTPQAGSEHASSGWGFIGAGDFKFAVEPPGGTCCEEQGGPGCSAAAVEACVCAADDFCCNNKWDFQCTFEVTALGCGTCVTPPDGDACCDSAAGPGCSPSSVETCVCEVDSFCCDNTWDDICVDEVVQLGCGLCGAPTADDCCSAHSATGCSLPSVESCVCAFDSFCCDNNWDDICVGEVESLACGTCG